MKIKTTILCAALLATSAHAEFRTGNKLLDEMNSEVNFSKGLALGYIMGVTDAGNGTNHCPPSTVTAGQLQDMVKNMLDGTPAIRHMPADAIVYYVLNKAWPCAKKGTAL